MAKTWSSGASSPDSAGTRSPQRRSNTASIAATMRTAKTWLDRAETVDNLGAGDGEVLRAADPFQGHQGMLGGQRDGGAVFAPGREGLPGGQPGGLAADPPPGFVAAADLFLEQDANDLGGVPPLGPGGGQDFGGGLAEVGEAHPAQHRIEGVRDRRRDGRGRESDPGHGWSPLPPAARDSLPLPLPLPLPLVLVLV